MSDNYHAKLRESMRYFPEAKRNMGEILIYPGTPKLDSEGVDLVTAEFDGANYRGMMGYRVLSGWPGWPTFRYKRTSGFKTEWEKVTVHPRKVNAYFVGWKNEQRDGLKAWMFLDIGVLLRCVDMNHQCIAQTLLNVQTNREDGTQYLRLNVDIFPIDFVIARTIPGKGVWVLNNDKARHVPLHKHVIGTQEQELLKL